MGKHTLAWESYHAQNKIWPQSGRVILGQHDEESIVVYQAYKPSIARYAAENHKFVGAPDFSQTRMTWIKTNFLWMMFRSGWGSKKDQERTLAIWLKKSAFEGYLAQCVKSSPRAGETKEQWQAAVKASNIRLQWDPDHLPDGTPLKGATGRRAVQLGLKGVRTFLDGTDILRVQDISNLIDENKPLELTPSERPFYPPAAIAENIGLPLPGAERADGKDSEGAAGSEENREGPASASGPPGGPPASASGAGPETEEE